MNVLQKGGVFHGLWYDLWLTVVEADDIGERSVKEVNNDVVRSADCDRQLVHNVRI